MADASDYSSNKRDVSAALRVKLTETVVGLFDLEDMATVVRALDEARAELGRRRRDELARQGWII